MHLSNSNSNNNLDSQSNTSDKLQNQNSYKLGFSALSCGGLAFLLLGLGASHAAAQLTIQSTGTISGTLRFPFGPTTNGRVTRIDTDKNGTYFRNIGTRSNPNLVPVYSSEFVQIETNPDGSIKRSFVDFLGLQFISSDGSINSPALSGGQLKTYRYQGRPNPEFQVNFQASVQDELSLQRAFYEGVVTDPKTGQQYQGVFEINGQGPRYSDRNGGDSPTVFDFQTDYNPKGTKPRPALNSYTMKNTPLVRLTIKVPAGMQPINPGGTPVAPPVVTPVAPPVVTPVTPPVVTPVTPPVVTPVTPPIATPVTPPIATPVTPPIATPVTPPIATPVTPPVVTPVTPPIATPVTPPVVTPVTPPIATPVTPPIATPVTPPISTLVTAPIATPVTAPIDSDSFISSSPTAPTISTPTSPSSQPGIEFSSGKVAINSDSAIRQITSEQTVCLQDTVNCRPQNQSRPIGPRSRVLVR
ncbi:MAG: hypothetical protein KME29_39450 [Calothrix sp. FI2-JRJ7]|jgi:hypothetical protein|nr:hypothetical protein [Calothrix sp. FI2-JRJ7]